MNAELAYDAVELQKLVDSPGWLVLWKYLENGVTTATAMALDNPLQTDQLTHHWRGYRAALRYVEQLPDFVISEERRVREAK